MSLLFMSEPTVVTVMSSDEKSVMMGIIPILIRVPIFVKTHSLTQVLVIWSGFSVLLHFSPVHLCSSGEEDSSIDNLSMYVFDSEILSFFDLLLSWFR